LSGLAGGAGLRRQSADEVSRSLVIGIGNPSDDSSACSLRIKTARWWPATGAAAV